MSKTIQSTYTATVTLTSTASNPVTVTNTAKLTPSAGAGGYGALYGKGGSGKGWTITNAGFINDGTNGNGIQLGQGGTYVAASVITNQAGGTIIGAYGIRMYNTVAGSITNLSGALIEATSNRGVYFNAFSTLTNSGTITAPTQGNQQLGVVMESGGVLINNATGTITGYGGVVMIGSSTLTNAGTIKAKSTTAYGVRLGSGGSKLIADPGAVFYGQVYGGSGTLELASAATAGTLTATSFERFSVVKFDAGSKWTLIGDAPSTANTYTALNGSIQGFTSSETIDVVGFVAVSATYASGLLTLTNAGSAHTTLHFSGSSLNTGNFHMSTYGTAGTNISFVACYAAGTRIETERGDVAVEDLRGGDRVYSHLSGQFVPVRWIGHRRVDCSRQPDPRKVWPVCVRASAFGDNLPRRDLWLSPDHAVFVDNLLIPIKLLINDASIAQVPVVEIAYYHIELPLHDVLLAEGLPAESYLDVGDRSNFETSDGVMRLFPDFSTRPVNIANLWEARGCAPLVIQGPKLEATQSWVNALADSVAKTG